MSKDKRFESMEQFKAHNAAQGYHYFSKETMRWWKSKVESTMIAGQYFLTSEDDWRGNRIYCVREALEDGRVKTIKSHLPSKDAAKEYLADYRAGKLVEVEA